MVTVVYNSGKIQKCFPVKRQKDMQSKLKFHSVISVMHGGQLQITIVEIVYLSFAMIFCFYIPISKKKKSPQKTTKNKKQKQTNKQTKKRKKTRKKSPSVLKKVNCSILIG